jgi:hypothetical protein
MQSNTAPSARSADSRFVQPLDHCGTQSSQGVLCRGCVLNPRLAMLVLRIFLACFLGLPIAAAQARIDPSLPEAPLPHNRALLLFAGYDTVHDPDATVPPLPVKQKFELAYRSTIDLSSPIRAGVTTLFDRSLGVGPLWFRSVRLWQTLRVQRGQCGINLLFHPGGCAFSVSPGSALLS